MTPNGLLAIRRFIVNVTAVVELTAAKPCVVTVLDRCIVGFSHPFLEYLHPNPFIYQVYDVRERFLRPSLPSTIKQSSFCLLPLFRKTKKIFLRVLMYDFSGNLITRIISGTSPIAPY